MRPMRILSLASLAAALLAAPAAAQAPAADLRPCTSSRLPEGSRCGTVRVPENRDRPGGRQIDLSVIVVPSTAGVPARTATAFFGGGPGQSATDFVGVSRGHPLAGLREAGDMLFVDQRGTGGSGGLECHLRDPANPQTYLDDFIPPARAAACLDSLTRTGADLARYTYPELAHDTEAVRRALGYETLDLWGASYGTRAALVYMRMYPASVRTATLIGVVPMSFLQPKTYAANTEAALAGIFAECRADAACNAAFPDAERELREVAARLERAPGEGEILDPATRRRVRLRLSRGDFAETIRKMMYNPASARLIPFAVHRAHAGDFRPLLRAALADRRGSTASSWGLYLALTCTEDVPFIDQAAAARDNGRTLLGDYRVRQQAAACRGWPRGTVPPGYHEPVRSDAPVLLISGSLDPVTPASGGTEAAATLPNSVHLVMPGGAHGSGGMPGDACVDSLVVRFVKAGSMQGLDVDGCVARIRSPGFTLDAPEPITLERAALERYAGSFANADSSFAVRVDPIDGGLHVHGQGFNFVGEPLSPTLFQWSGLPPGYVIEFAADGSSATLRGPGEDPTHITRRP